jgi:hypothetical protein
VHPDAVAKICQGVDSWINGSPLIPNPICFQPISLARVNGPVKPTNISNDVITKRRKLAISISALTITANSRYSKIARHKAILENNPPRSGAIVVNPGARTGSIIGNRAINDLAHSDRNIQPTSILISDPTSIHWNIPEKTIPTHRGIDQGEHAIVANSYVVIDHRTIFKG